MLESASELLELAFELDTKLFHLGGQLVSAPTGEIHLETRCASEGILKGVASEGEFHEIIESASQVLLAGVAPTGEIHLKHQCASEVPVTGVRLRGGHKVVPPPTPTCPRRPSEGGRLER